MTAREVAARHPLPAGLAATEPEEGECHHGVPGQWHRWEWRPGRGETEESSEPVILEAPPGCHACLCADPLCARCEG